GPEDWHPNPSFLFQEGAGPLYDIAPYYVTTLALALGPVVSVSAAGSRARDKRTIGSGPKAGEVFDVTVPTQVAALLHFESGQNATVLLSFDSPHRRTGFVEIYGTDATLAFPDPNVFEGDSALTVYRGDEPTPVPAGGAATGRGMGVVARARALRSPSPPAWCSRLPPPCPSAAVTPPPRGRPAGRPPGAAWACWRWREPSDPAPATEPRGRLPRTSWTRWWRSRPPSPRARS